MYNANDAKKTSNIIFNSNFDKYIEIILEIIKQRAEQGFGQLNVDTLAPAQRWHKWASLSFRNRELISEKLEQLGFSTSNYSDQLIINW